MKLTKKQQQEVDFFSRNCSPTASDVKEYIYVTVHGAGSGKVGAMSRDVENPLLVNKRILDIQIKEWRHDLTIGLLSVEELRQDQELQYPYIQKIIDQIIKSVTPEYRLALLSKQKEASPAAIGNFPALEKAFGSIRIHGVKLADIK